jgi:hypothetical protein
MPLSTRSRPAASLACLALLAACRLVDQTSFGGAPRPPAPNDLAAALASHGQAPLLVIRPADRVPYDQQLRDAILAAEAKNGATRFRLESVVPAGGDLQAQQTAMNETAAAASAVLDAMAQSGIPPDRVTLGTRTDPTVTRSEIRLYQT